MPEFEPNNKRILLIAPQPFYEDRGTPIVIRNTLQCLGELGFKVDLATFPVGSENNLPNVKVFRAANPLGFRHVPIGLSFRKVVLDTCLLTTVLRLVKNNRYDCIHGVEEGATLAMLSKKLFGIPVIYDMHSSLPEQLRQIRGLRSGPGRWLSLQLERWLIRSANCIIGSRGLEPHVHSIAPGKTVFEVCFRGVDPRPKNKELVKQLGISGRPTVVYTGNFAPYQGVAELIEAAALVRACIPEVVFVLVGGTEADITRLNQLVEKHELVNSVRLLRRCPWQDVPDYLALADVLALSRCRGDNAPVKVYDYLRTGKPIVATDIPAHRVLLSEETAIMVEPNSRALADGILHALQDADRAANMVLAAQDFCSSQKIKPLIDTISEAYSYVLS